MTEEGNFSTLELAVMAPVFGTAYAVGAVNEQVKKTKRFARKNPNKIIAGMGVAAAVAIALSFKHLNDLEHSFPTPK